MTGGAYHRFDQGSVSQLAELLKAVALFSVGGIAASLNDKDRQRQSSSWLKSHAAPDSSLAVWWNGGSLRPTHASRTHEVVVSSRG